MQYLTELYIFFYDYCHAKNIRQNRKNDDNIEMLRFKRPDALSITKIKEQFVSKTVLEMN